MTSMWVGQRVGIRVVQPGAEADALVAALVDIVGINAGISHPDDDPGLTIVQLDQTDAESGAASIREMAAQRDESWARLVSIDVLPPAVA